MSVSMWICRNPNCRTRSPFRRSIASGRLNLEALYGELNPLEDFARVFAAEKAGEDRKQFFQIGEQEDVRDPWHCR